MKITHFLYSNYSREIFKNVDVYRIIYKTLSYFFLFDIFENFQQFALKINKFHIEENRY